MGYNKDRENGITCNPKEASVKTGYFLILIYFLFLVSKNPVDSGKKKEGWFSQVFLVIDSLQN